ncbi:MAG: glutathionylspermidine synthase family protein [Sphingobacteriales bacterium]|nr:MAG: glutathionylspermidine synthase family protein [Sphingobacteriales bacterium]
MKRHTISPRPDWEEKIKAHGFLFYKNESYYTETACYEFSSEEIDALDTATAECFDMCLKVVQHVIDHNLWDEFHIPKQYADLIKWSWDNDMPSIYGRMDMVYNNGSIKMLEFNADTPTSLLEASVVQWYWLQEYKHDADQFNSIHEKLVAHFKTLKQDLYGSGKLHFSCINGNTEDYMTTKYLEDAAHQAGITTDFLYIEDVQMDNARTAFYTDEEQPIENLFKLYPYEWMMHEMFGPFLPSTREQTLWIEPAYKAILSNKMLMVYLHKLFPDSPYILPAFSGKWDASVGSSYVKKPVFSREGANVEIVEKQMTIEHSGGDYGEEGYIYQQYAPLPYFDGNRPVIGSWLIGGQTAGIGIRESDGLITGNTSRFVPHFFG